MQPDEPVVGLQAQLLQRVEDPRGDPLISWRGSCSQSSLSRRPFRRPPEHQRLVQLAEDHPIRDPWLATAQWVDDHTFGKQPGELARQRVDYRRWQRRHKYLVGEETSLDNP